MADRKISDLTALTTPAAGDYLPIVDISEASNASKNKRITIEELLRGAPDGTAGAPSIGFESDPDSGLYSAGANQVAISTNGTGRLFVDASGRLLAGSSVAGDGDADNLNLADATNPGITLRGSSTGTGSIYFADGTAGDDLKRGQIRYSHADNALLFATQATEKLRITSDGRLGLGTSNPQNILHLTQSSGDAVLRIQNDGADGNKTGIRFQNSLDNTNHSGGIYCLRNGGTDHDLLFQTYGSGAGNTRMVIKNNGNVGIGTTSPSSLLHLADAGNITVGTTTGTKIGTATTQKLGFYNATPVVQPAAVADATDAATVITQLNDLLAKLRTLGLIAT